MGKLAWDACIILVSQAMVTSYTGLEGQSQSPRGPIVMASRASRDGLMWDLALSNHAWLALRHALISLVVFYVRIIHHDLAMRLTLKAISRGNHGEYHTCRPSGMQNWPCALKSHTLAELLMASALYASSLTQEPTRRPRGLADIDT